MGVWDWVVVVFIGWCAGGGWRGGRAGLKLS